MTERPTTPSDDSSELRKSRPLLRLLLLGLPLAGIMLAVCFSPLRLWLQDTDRVRSALQSLGPWAYPVYILAVAILVGCGIPRLIFCAIGGLILGFWWGLLLTQAGTLLGYYIVFLFVRWAGRQWILLHFPKLRKFAGTIREQGVIGVILIRQLPIHGTLVNMCLGLSRVKHRHFLIGTLIGLVPEAVPVTLAGAGLVKASRADSARYLAYVVIAVAAAWLACNYALRILRRGQPDSELESAMASTNARSDVPTRG